MPSIVKLKFVIDLIKFDDVEELTDALIMTSPFQTNSTPLLYQI